MKNNLFIISGPSGSGKDSVIEGLRDHFEIERVVTTTARLPRPEESEGKPYYFVSTEEFENKIKNNEMAEWAKEDNGQYYGVTTTELDRVRNSARIGIWRIGYHGVVTIKKLYPEIRAILINTPDLATLEKRIRARDKNASEEYIQQRMDYTREWLQHKNIYDFEVINKEGELKETIAKTAQIIKNISDEQKSN
jgi:guanylate kinase